MLFSQMMVDRVSISKKTGEVIDNIPSSVQRDTIYLMKEDILIEPGDIAKRELANGGIEVFEVVDPIYREAVLNFPACYCLAVKKVGVENERDLRPNIVYNIVGNNSRVNSNSVDNSSNIVNIDNRIINEIAKIREEINKSSEINKSEAHDVLEAIEQQFRSGSPKKTVVISLLEALPKLGSIASIISCIKSFFS